MQLFFDKHIEHTQKEFTFSKEESRHIVKVLRKKEGDILHITNGKGYLFTCSLISASDKKCIVQITNAHFQEPKLNYKLHIAIAPTKNNVRLEWFLEKATEIGITKITPIICDHSERKVIKKERLEKVVISAMKQANRLYLPVLKEAISYVDFIKNNTAKDSFIAHCYESDKVEIKSALSEKTKDICILIGPEGDFSEKEVELAIENNFIPISISNSRLRTETAGIVAVHSVAFYFG